MKTEFENLGYSIDYMIAGKFIGSLTVEALNGRTIGYHGRLTETLEDALILKNGKKIAAGKIVTSEVFPVCGRIKKIS